MWMNFAAPSFRASAYLWYGGQGLFEIVIVVGLVGGVLHLDHVKVLKRMDAWIHKIFNLQIKNASVSGEPEPTVSRCQLGSPQKNYSTLSESHSAISSSDPGPTSRRNRDKLRVERKRRGAWENEQRVWCREGALKIEIGCPIQKTLTMEKFCEFGLRLASMLSRPWRGSCR